MHKINPLYISLIATFLLAGFSQISFGSFRPGNIILLVLFVILIAKRYYILTSIYVFIIFSISYAFLIGGLSKPILFFTEFLTFSIFFSLFKYFSRIEEYKIIKLLTLFNYSIFISNCLALTFLLILPQFRDLVVDTSSLGFRLKGFFGQANGYAFIQIITIPISTYIIIKKRNLLNFLILIISFIVLIFTQSRGAILSLLISTCIVYMLYLMNYDILKKLRKIAFPIIIMIAIIFAIITFLPDYIETNFGLNLTRINPLKESTSERSIAAFSYKDIENDRFYLIKNGFVTIFKYPWGLGYQEQHIIIGRITGTSLIPHNFYIDLLLDFGILIGLIWNLIITYIVYRGIKFFIRNRISHSDLFFFLQIIILSVLLFYLTHSPKWTYFYIIFAIYISYLFLPNNKNKITTNYFIK